jgi:SnoaL-like domain
VAVSHPRPAPKLSLLPSASQSGQYGRVEDELALRLQTAFNERNIDVLRSLLAEDATWGEDPEGEQYCHDRNDVIRNVKRLLAEGVQARITETTVGPHGIAAHLQVEWPDPEDAPPNRLDFFQVYVVADGLVTEIHGHDDRASALAAISA